MKAFEVMRMDILFFSLEVVNCEEQGSGSTTRLVTSTVVCGPHFYYKKKKLSFKVAKRKINLKKMQPPLLSKLAHKVVSGGFVWIYNFTI